MNFKDKVKNTRIKIENIEIDKLEPTLLNNLSKKLSKYKRLLVKTEKLSVDLIKVFFIKYSAYNENNYDVFGVVVSTNEFCDNKEYFNKKYDYIVNIEKVINTPDTPFFKALFFDEYMDDTVGASDGVQNFTLFAEYAKAFLKKETWINKNFTQDRIFDNDNYLLFAGTSFHRINFYFKKISDNNYDLYIIDSAQNNIADPSLFKLDENMEIVGSGVNLIMKFEKLKMSKVLQLIKYANFYKSNNSAKTITEYFNSKKENLKAWNCEHGFIDIYRKFNISDFSATNQLKIYYANIAEYLKDYKILKIYKDKSQSSGTCAFFSIYYFYKYLFESIKNISMFDKFINFIKIDIALQLTHKLKDNVLFNLTFKNNIINIIDLIIKDNMHINIFMFDNLRKKFTKYLLKYENSLMVNTIKDKVIPETIEDSFYTEDEQMINAYGEILDELLQNKLDLGKLDLFINNYRGQFGSITCRLLNHVHKKKENILKINSDEIKDIDRLFNYDGEFLSTYLDILFTVVIFVDSAASTNDTFEMKNEDLRLLIKFMLKATTLSTSDEISLFANHTFILNKIIEYPYLTKYKSVQKYLVLYKKDCVNDFSKEINDVAVLKKEFVEEQIKQQKIKDDTPPQIFTFGSFSAVQPASNSFTFGSAEPTTTPAKKTITFGGVSTKEVKQMPFTVKSKGGFLDGPTPYFYFDSLEKNLGELIYDVIMKKTDADLTNIIIIVKYGTVIQKEKLDQIMDKIPYAYYDDNKIYKFTLVDDFINRINSNEDISKDNFNNETGFFYNMDSKYFGLNDINYNLYNGAAKKEEKEEKEAIYQKFNNNYYETYLKTIIDKINLSMLIIKRNDDLFLITEELLVLCYCFKYEEFQEKKREILDFLRNYQTENKKSSLLYKFINGREIDNSYENRKMNTILTVYSIRHSDNLVSDEKEFIRPLIHTDDFCKLYGIPVIENYKNVIDEKIINEFSTEIPIYSRDDKSYYFMNNERFEITIDLEKPEITRNIEDSEEKLVLSNEEKKLIEQLSTNYQTIIIKVYNMAFCNLWNTESHLIVDVYKFNFKIKLNKKKEEAFIIYNNEIYDVVFENNKYTLFMDNGIFVKKDYDNYIFLIMDKSFFHPIEFRNNKNYFVDKLNINLETSVTQKYFNLNHYKKIHIIELLNSDLNINISNIEIFQALQISLLFAKNYLAYDELGKSYGNSIYAKHIDFLNKNGFLNEYNKIFKTNFDIKDRNGTYNLTELKKMKEYKFIKSISEKMNNKKSDSLDKYYDDENIKDYIKSFRFNCAKFNKSDLFDDEINASYMSNNSLNYNLLFYKQGILDSQNINVLDIYDKYYIELYRRIIVKKYNKIIANLHKLDENEYNCTNILEIIEHLDPEIIYDLDNARTMSQVVFELTNELFLRNEQVVILSNMRKQFDLKNFSDAYEILMGKGKTSTITPMIILEHCIEKKYEDYAFNIVLPSHLVEQSYGILIKYIQTLTLRNYNINLILENFDYEKSGQINIVSEDTLKKSILDRIKIGDIPDKINDTFFIFDEIDTLIDPLKSDLNMPDNNCYDHSLKNMLNSIVIKIIKILLDKTNSKRTNNISDNVKIKNSKNEIIYSFYVSLDEKLNLYKFVEAKINHTIKIVEKLIFRKNYGFGDYDYKNSENSENKKHFYTAIPYKAVNTPINSSEFTDYETLLFLTTKTYFENKFRKEDIVLLLTYMNSHYEKDLDLFEIEFEQIFKIIKKDIIVDSFALINNKSLFIEKCENLLKFFNEGIQFEELMEIYLNKVIFNKFFKIYKNQYNVSTIDLFSPFISKEKISFSGTVNFNKPSEIINEIATNSSKIIKEIGSSQISNINEDKLTKGAIICSLTGITTETPQYFYYSNNRDDINDIFNVENNFIEWLKINIINYDCLIDSGGLIINNTPKKIVEIISGIIKDKIIIYIDENDVRQIYNKTGDIPYSNQVFQNIFIYYDHRHCVGIDIKQPNVMKGIVSVNHSSTLTEISQGIYRLRKINKGHHVDFYCPDNIVNTEDVYFLYNYLNKNEINYKINTTKYMKLQCSKYIYRQILQKSTSYIDELFYDLQKYHEKYYNNNTFINEFIISKYNEHLSNKSIKIKYICFDDIDEKINTQISSSINVSIDITQNIQMQISNKYKDKILFNLTRNYANILPFDNNNSFNITYSKLTNDTLLNINNIHISISPLLIFNFNREEIILSFSFYFLYIGSLDKANSIFIIHQYDYNNLIIFKDSMLTNYSNIFIFDMFGKSVFAHKVESNYDIPRNIAQLIKLLTTDKISSVELYNILYNMKDDLFLCEKLDFYSNLLGKIFNFNIDNLKLLTKNSFLNKDTWIKLFNIEDNEILSNILINNYILKYQSDIPIIIFNSKKIYINKLKLNEQEVFYLFDVIKSKEYVPIVNIPVNVKISALCKLNQDYENNKELIDKIKKELRDSTICCHSNKDLTELLNLIREQEKIASEYFLLNKDYLKQDFLITKNTSANNSLINYSSTDYKIQACDIKKIRENKLKLFLDLTKEVRLKIEEYSRKSIEIKYKFGPNFKKKLSKIKDKIPTHLNKFDSIYDINEVNDLIYIIINNVKDYTKFGLNSLSDYKCDNCFFNSELITDTVQNNVKLIELPILTGGSRENYYAKYIKYKIKYTNLKKLKK